MCMHIVQHKAFCAWIVPNMIKCNKLTGHHSSSVILWNPLVCPWSSLMEWLIFRNKGENFIFSKSEDRWRPWRHQTQSNDDGAINACDYYINWNTTNMTASIYFTTNVPTVICNFLAYQTAEYIWITNSLYIKTLSMWPRNLPCLLNKTSKVVDDST